MRKKQVVDLVWLSDAMPPDWEAGCIWQVAPDPASIAELVAKNISGSRAGAWLFWDDTCGKPDLDTVEGLLATPLDGFHAGLRLGTRGLPGIIDFIHPTWMHNRDPDPTILASSWRLSLRACLLRTEVLRQLGGLRSEFRSMDAAALEMGHRFLRRGAMVQHVPGLVTEAVKPPRIDIPAEDELRFALFRFGPKWARWALIRALQTGYRPRAELLAAWHRVSRERCPDDPAPYRHPAAETVLPANAKVTVLIPTLQRYPYLRTVLNQLRTQTVPPHEVIVVDQTPLAERDENLAAAYPDLPIHVIHRDEAGQCRSRNAGLLRSTGDWVLLLDDDIEIGDDLIERHLRTCNRFGAQASSGVIDEVGAGSLPPAFRYVRVSNVFPAGNTLIRINALTQTGLFDLAYDRGQRADGDLGMRAYLSGALMILDPEISILHHHAPRGGLRVHGARVITYASSRSRLSHRHLPSVSEIYLAKRYFTARQVRETIWLRVFGTMSSRGSRWKKLMKVAIGLVLLPNTVWTVWRRYLQAEAMLQEYPQIPQLNYQSAPTEEDNISVGPGIGS